MMRGEWGWVSYSEYRDEFGRVNDGYSRIP